MIKKIRSLTNLISILLLFSISFGYDFPIIDDFEDGDYTLSTAWTFEAALNTSIINNASGARGHYSTRITGTTSGYWVGAGRADLTPFLDDWTEYKYFSIWVNNRGEIGDKLQIRIIDNDNDANNPWDDDQFVYEIPIYKQNVWVEVIIPYTLFIDDIIWNSDGDGIFNLDPYEGKAGVSAVKVGFNSITTAGAIAMDIDEISLRDTTNGVDSDADGLPDDWENIYELDPNNANGSNGGNGDPDGDGITNLAEYINETVPKNIFPVIDNFEDADPTSLPTWDINDNISLSTINAGSDGNYSVQIIGTAFGNYAGYLSAYIGDKDTDWSGYNFVHLVLNNMGQAGDKLKIEIFDNDNDNYDIDSGSWLSGDDKFAYEFSLNKKDQWQDIYIPYSVFTDINANTGNNTFDIAPANNFPGVLMIGLAFNSATDSGAITINIDKISLAATINETDSDNDGLPDDWEQQYGLNASSANGDDGPTGNPDGDAYTNLEEYINGTVPKSTATISSKYYINEGADGWGNGSWGAGSVAASYQISNNYYHQLEINDNSFSAKNGMWIGITSNSDQPVVDLGNYKKIVFDLRSDNGELFIYLKDKNDNVSSKYKYLNINAGEFTSFEISMNYFQTGSFDISGVREILFEPAEISLVPQTINIRNIYFDEGDLSTGVLNTPIVDELILRNFLSGDPYSPLTSTTDYKEASKHLWNSYKARFIDSYKSIVTQGLNLEGLVFDPYVGSSTTKIEAGDYAKSEGSGYAMLLAVYMNDQAAFDEIFDGTWASQMHKSTSSNLFAWNINTDGTFVNNDKNSASDADQDIAFSLILADTLVQSEIWSNTSREYDKKAQSLINALYEYTISKNKYLMPSDEAGRLGFNEVDNPTNPSYFSPAWYRIFDMYENNDHDWGAIIDWGYALVVSADPNGIGLNPDWCDYWGNDKETANFYHYMTGKDAVRVQWRLATDWLWFGETKAQTYLEKTKSVFSYPGSIGPGSIAPINVKPLELNGAYSYETRGDGYNYTDVSLVSMFAAGAMGSNNDNYRKEWKGAFDNYMYLAQNGLNSFLGEKLNGAEAKIDFDSQMNYYNHCLGILSALMVSGAFPNVYSATNMPTNNLLSPVIDSFEDGNLTNTQNWTAANNIDISIVNQSQNDTYSIRGTGQAGQSGPSSNYYVGYSSAYLGNTILDWSNYKYLKLIIKNDGQVGDKIKIEIIDNDTLTYSVLEAAGTGGDDKFAYEFSMLWTGTWKEIYIPYSMFTDVNPNTGNNTFDLKPQTDYPGTLLLGFAYNSIEKTGRVTVDIDDISISQATNVTDADEDGMDDSWESSNGLNSSNGTDGATDADADGYSNFEEYINGTNPQVKNIFPVVDNFENTGLVWSAADGLLVVTESFAEPSILNAMKMTGTAVTYNSGFNGAYIGSSLNDWDKYSSIKFMIRNDGQVGDKIKIQLTDNDNDDYAGENGTDDVWAFEQVINTTATWSYYTIPFSYFIDTNPLSGNDTLDLSPSGNYPGAVYLGIVNLSKTATGNTEIYIDNIEVSTTPTSDDNDGDGLPNYWEEQYSLSTNSAASLNGTNGDPDADGYDNFTEYLNGTNPIVANVFPIVENYDDGDFTAGPEWTATDNLSLVMDSGAMKMSGTATNYYTGFAGAYIADPYADWDSYSAIKFRLKNNGQVGDKIKIQLTDDDNGNGTIEEADDDVWAFEQVINTTGNWVYFNLPFSLFADMNTANVDTALNFEKTGNNPGVLYIGIANNSVVTEGSTEILIDDIEVSNVPTTNDNDGDGLPNDWETQYGLSTNSSVSNNGTSGDPDGDGYSNLVEYTNNTDPTQKEWFPIIDNYDDGNINLNPVWNANDGLVLTMDSGAMKMSGSATDYYTGFAGASIASPYADWSTYSSIKFKLKNNGVVGDKIKIQLTDNDNVGGIEANDDEWAFEQVINTTATWSYYTVLFSSMEDMNPATGNSTIDFGKTGNEPGILYIGIANNSKTATGSTDIYIDNIEVSTTPTSNDNDGDGLPNYWEEQYSLSTNSAVSPNGTNSDPDGDGYDNFTEYLNGTNPIVANVFPIVDNYDDNNYNVNPEWTATDNLSLVMDSGALKMSGTATNYYTGFAGAYIADPYADWDSYSAIKFRLKNNGQLGDKIKIQLTDDDNGNGTIEEAADDVWAFEQVINTTGNWVYFNLPFSLFADMNTTNVDTALNFEKTGNNPGVLYIGIANNSVVTKGSTEILIDDIEVSNVPTTNDNDGDGLPNDWETQYGLSTNSSVSNNGTSGDPDGDGYSNLVEYTNNTNPTQKEWFPIIDNYDDGNINLNPSWNVNDGLVLAIGSGAMKMSGIATNYYTGFAGASIGSPYADWSAYSSIKFKLKNNGEVGDKIKIQLTDNDNVGGIEDNDDVWDFEQVINTTATWSYYTILFSNMDDMNPATGNAIKDFGKTGNEPGIVYIGIANNSKTATGSTDIYIDNIEVSTTPTSNDNDGDGLPNYWEEQHSLSANSAVSPNGTNSDPDGDGYDNFTEYLNHSNPMSAEKFPVIDDFEGISNLSETSWNVNELTTKEIVSNTLHLSGTASNYYAGYLSNYVGNYIFDWSSYSYLKIDIKNNGQIGDKIAVTIVDNDKAGYDVDYDADDTYQVKIIFSDTGVSNSYYIPLPSMRDLDVSSGDNVQNFTPIDPEYPGVSFIGFAFNSTSSSGVVDVNIDKIELTTTIYYTADSDGDSLLDVWEKLYSFNENSSTGYDGAAGDPDGDGMPNLIEQNNMTDPSFGNSQMIDSDSDGMPNNWETRFGLIPSINDAAGDSDGDTLSNYVEYLLGSSPLTSNADTSFYPDTDTDGLPDYWEIAYGLSPTVSNAVSDTDSDGKTDLQEYQLGTNPNDQRISLSTGWNLISIGISGNNVSEVVASINVQNGGGINISQVYYMDNATKAWKSYDAEASSGDDPVLSYGEAIFVNSKSNLTYLPAGNRVSSHTYEFYNGWNAMGKDIGSAYTAKEMSDEIKNAGGDILRIYKLENGSWKYYNAETGAGENFTITKYKGLYISFGSNYTWTPLK